MVPLACLEANSAANLGTERVVAFTAAVFVFQLEQLNLPVNIHSISPSLMVLEYCVGVMMK